MVTIKTTKEILIRFEDWVNRRGVYILPEIYLKELEDFVFLGKSKTLFNMKNNKRT